MASRHSSSRRTRCFVSSDRIVAVSVLHQRLVLVCRSFFPIHRGQWSRTLEVVVSNPMNRHPSPFKVDHFNRTRPLSVPIVDPFRPGTSFERPEVPHETYRTRSTWPRAARAGQSGIVKFRNPRPLRMGMGEGNGHVPFPQPCGSRWKDGCCEDRCTTNPHGTSLIHPFKASSRRTRKGRRATVERVRMVRKDARGSA